MAATSLSVWAQELIDHLTHHMDDEREALRAYGELAAQTSDPRVGGLVRQILDDEIRHHQQFSDLRDALRAEVEQRAPKLHNGVQPGPVVELLAQTEELIELERADRKALRSLAKRLRQVEDTKWRASIVEAMELDTRKHLLLLDAIRDLLGEG
jgi:rubrerythrin